MSAGLKPIVQTFKPSVDMSSAQFQPVKLDPGTGSENVTSCSADDAAIGIVMNAPTTTDVAEVAVAQGAKVVCSTTVTAGDHLRAAGSGQMKPVTTGGFDAIAMNSGIAGDVIPVIIAHGYFTT